MTYKKAINNEVEMQEIDGVKVTLRLTVDEKLDIIATFKEQQKNKDMDVRAMADILTTLLYNSVYLWDNKRRTQTKAPGFESVEKEDVRAFVVDNLFDVWLSVLDALKILDKKKLEELQKEMIEKQKGENPKL